MVKVLTLVDGHVKEAEVAPRQEFFRVTTNSSGNATITFSPPFISPHICTAVQSSDTGDNRQVSVEFSGLSGSGVTVKTTREGSGVSLLGLIVLSPTDRVSTVVHVTVTELA